MPMPPSGAPSPSLSASNICVESPPTLSPSITVPHRPDGLDQAPERAEQAEEDQQAGHVARDVARLVEAVGDRVQDPAHGLRRHRHAAHAVAQDRLHRREQHRRALDREAGIGEPEAVDPGDLGKQPQHLAEREHDADQQHAHDQAVEARIGEERRPDLLVEDDDQQGAEHEKHHHPDQKDPGRAHLERVDIVVLLRHGGSAVCGGGPSRVDASRQSAAGSV